MNRLNIFITDMENIASHILLPVFRAINSKCRRISASHKSCPWCRVFCVSMHILPSRPLTSQMVSVSLRLDGVQQKRNKRSRIH